MTLLKDSAFPHAVLAAGTAAGPLVPAEELFPATLPGDRDGQQAPELTTVLDIMERIFRLV
ncbi:hypothetical protein [Streptomyces sp. NPDC047000]|uniref:hypothetical protein n=1 Tax=Streptomyces sp. NPDC047000 TaxID=3155474 RepID=UPI00340DBE59